MLISEFHTELLILAPQHGKLDNQKLCKHRKHLFAFKNSRREYLIVKDQLKSKCMHMYDMHFLLLFINYWMESKQHESIIRMNTNNTLLSSITKGVNVKCSKLTSPCIQSWCIFPNLHLYAAVTFDIKR